jgi:hypothetical protein
MARITSWLPSRKIEMIAEVTIRMLLKVKSVPISPRQPDVPKTIFAGALFWRANFSMTGSSFSPDDASASIAFQHEDASLYTLFMGASWIVLQNYFNTGTVSCPELKAFLSLRLLAQGVIIFDRCTYYWVPMEKNSIYGGLYGRRTQF